MNSIKKNRDSKGWTQSELANKLDVSINTVWRWEAGQITPSMKNLKEMSKLFNCTIDDLVDESNPTTSAGAEAPQDSD